MRQTILALCVLFGGTMVAGCGGKEDNAPKSDMTSDSPFAVYAGDWMTEVYSLDGGEPLVATLLKATDSQQGWSMKFTHMDEAVPANTVFLKGDSVVMEIGPYPSALREGATVQSVTSYLHKDGDAMSGRFHAVYDDGAELDGRLSSERVK